jgi:signal transduction histidine kinase
VHDALQLVQYAVSAAFVLLALLALRDWLRYRERSRGYLAVAVGLLGVVTILGRVSSATGGQLGRALTDISIVVLMAAGYSLLLFRDAFIPLSRRVRIGSLIVLAAITAFVLLALPGTPSSRPSVLETVATLALVLGWSACVLEPIVRFWRASRGRPAVQRARLRALAAGYAILVIILLVSGIAGAAGPSDVVQFFIQVVALLAVPLLYASFAPPRWLRRIWREAEEEELRDAVQDLLLFSPDRATLAHRASEWGLRLVGAEGIAILEPTGEILAIRGMDADVARRLAAQVDPPGQASLLATPGFARENAIVIRLPLDTGSGALVVVSGPFTPFFGSDEVSRLSHYATNITAALDRARMTERMAALDRTKSQFLNLASHELRSPLGVINGYLSMLEQGSLGQLKEPGIRAIEVLKAKALEMNMLVGQMLEAARLEDGHLGLKRDRVDLCRVATEAIEVIRPLATAGHKLDLEVPADPVVVVGDEDRLVTIVTNLLENAIKYSPQGGPVQCAVARSGDTASITVSDKGVGIASSDLPRLFNRFERLHNRETSHVGGTGLGLYLSRELARQHGGDLAVESRPRAGSTFTLTLPVAVVRSQPASSPEPPAAQEGTVVEPPRLHVVAGDVESESRLA